MQFEIDGEQYILNFNKSAGRWYLLRPVFGGLVEAMEVFEDDAPSTSDIVVHTDAKSLKSIN